MKKIAQAELDRIANLVQECESALEEMETARESYLEAVTTIKSDLDGYREELHGIIDDALVEAEAYYDERSEKWQEGEKGLAYEQWKSTLDQLRDELADLPEFSVPELDEIPFLDTLKGDDYVEPME